MARATGWLRALDVVIDTDPGLGTRGVDPEDALALALAFASPELDVRGITCVAGNVPVRHGLANARHIVSLLGRDDVPVAAGPERPLAGHHGALRHLAESDRRERVLPAASPPYPDAAPLLGAASAVIAIGPLTNVATALRAGAEFERVVVMGGAFDAPGNVTATAEFNFHMDPEAVRIVLDSGVAPVLLGLDVCHRTHLTPAQLAAASLDSPFARFLLAAAGDWLPAPDDDGPYLYDSLAVACAIAPERFELAPAYITVEADGTSRAGRGANALVATDVDLEWFEALFTTRVLARL